MISNQLHYSRIASNYTASCSQPQDIQNISFTAPRTARSFLRKAEDSVALRAVMSTTKASAASAAAVIEDERKNAQTAVLQHPPSRKSTWERQELLRQVSDLKGRPFTAAFLAAATGVEVSEVICRWISMHEGVQSSSAGQQTLNSLSTSGLNRAVTCSYIFAFDQHPS